MIIFWEAVSDWVGKKREGDARGKKAEFKLR